jgi:acetyl-CoA carboxylase biotin carboxyl carrier protein
MTGPRDSEPLLGRDDRPNSVGTQHGDFGPAELAALVRDCVNMMHAGGIARLDLHYGKLKLNLRAHRAPRAAAAAASLPAGVQPSLFEPLVQQSHGHVITAPMIGTYYHSTAPGEPPLVAVGDRIEQGQTIGIIEAMKIMNEIAADRSGVVEEVLASNGQTVEYGSPLIRLASIVA